MEDKRVDSYKRSLPNFNGSGFSVRMEYKENLSRIELALYDPFGKIVKRYDCQQIEVPTGENFEQTFRERKSSLLKDIGKWKKEKGKKPEEAVA